VKDPSTPGILALDLKGFLHWPTSGLFPLFRSRRCSAPLPSRKGERFQTVPCPQPRGRRDLRCRGLRFRICLPGPHRRSPRPSRGPSAGLRSGLSSPPGDDPDSWGARSPFVRTQWMVPCWSAHDTAHPPSVPQARGHARRSASRGAMVATRTARKESCTRRGVRDGRRIGRHQADKRNPSEAGKARRRM
jgi:hypothetical protein